MTNKLKSFLLFLLIVLVILLSQGCKSTQSLVDTQEKDSVHVKVITRDVEVKVPGEKVFITKYIKCDSAGNVTPIDIEKRGDNVTARVKIDTDGKLEADCGTDTLMLLLKAQDSIIFRLKQTSRREIKIVPEYRSYWYDKIARPIALIAIVLVAGYILFRINKI